MAGSVPTYGIEQWRVVPGFEDYQVSEYGDIRRATFTSNRKGKPGDFIYPQMGNSGYYRIALWKDGKSSRMSIHRIVAFAFLGTPPTIGHEVSHLDGNKNNNHYENLAWVTRKENHSHKKIHGTAQCGDRNNNNKLNEKQVRDILSRKNATKADLAREFEVSHTTISRIINHQSWKHINLKEIV